MNLSDKKILVTGAGGFIGSHLVEALLDRGCEVRAFVHYNSFNSWGWLDTLPVEKLKQIDIVAGDIRDSNGVLQAIKGMDVVFHLAALIAIPFSYHSPDSYIDTNISGTLNVLQAARQLNIERIVVTSTSEVYGTAQYVPINESHPLQGQSPYSATKIGADKVAESFYRSFEIPVIIARPFNTYGPRQSARAIIPTLITQLISGEKKIMLGDISPTRDFNYVLDTVKGFIALCESDNAIGQEVNIATGTEHSIENLSEYLISMINPSALIIEDTNRVRPKNSEVFRLVGDNKKIKSLTSWAPCYTLEEGLQKTVAWFMDVKNINRYKSWVYNI
jgi:NAD dependent epimerase/dehydratase